MNSETDAISLQDFPQPRLVDGGVIITGITSSQRIIVLLETSPHQVLETAGLGIGWLGLKTHERLSTGLHSMLIRKSKGNNVQRTNVISPFARGVLQANRPYIGL